MGFQAMQQNWSKRDLQWRVSHGEPLLLVQHTCQNNVHNHKQTLEWTSPELKVFIANHIYKILTEINKI